MFRIIIAFCILGTVGDLFPQCSTPNPPAGLFCDPSLPNGAPLLCEIECLDGYTAMMPLYDDQASQDDQPSPLCDDMMGGQPNNMSWFAFIAGSSTIRFEITPFDCTGGINFSGVQAGIYGDCEGIEILYCESEVKEQVFEIGGPGFVPGNTYYFFIDGFEGSQCMYTVNVLEGEQPFPIPEIVDITTNHSSDTICRGALVEFNVLGLDQDSIIYTLSIDPPTIDYPTGFHPETRSPLTTWAFNEEGDFMICAQATNGCDVTDEFCIDITVRSIDDEIFSDVTICLEDLGNYAGPSAEDPNGDGILGWLGVNTFFPGINRDSINTMDGCTYYQEININVINPPARENVVLELCSTDFPYLYEGEVFNNPIEIFNLTLDNLAVSGCDSLVSLSLVEVNISGEIVVLQCENGEAVLEFIVTDKNPADLEFSSINWMDDLGNSLIDNGNDQPGVNVTTSGIFSLEIVASEEAQCNFSFVSENIIIDDLKPSPPAMIGWIIEPCEARLTTGYKANEVEEENAVYTWVVPSDVANFMDMGDSISIEWGNSSGGEICVSITNSCGTSDQSCAIIARKTMSSSNIIISGETCIDSQIEISAEPGLGIYQWDFGNSDIILSSDLTGPGPHVVELPNEGLDSISLIIIDGDCVSPVIVEVFDVVNQILEPEITCIASDNSILFQWDDVVGAVDYEVTVSTGHNGLLLGNSFEVQGLQIGDSVSIDIQSIASMSCANSNIVTSQCYAGCPQNPITIVGEIDEFCSGDQTAPLTLTIEGNTIGGQITWSGGDFVDASGNFISENARIGENVVVADLLLNQCIYSDTLIVVMNAMPEWSYELISSFCIEDEDGMLILLPPPSSGELSYRLDDGTFLGDTTLLQFGNYTVTAIDSKSCTQSETIAINSPEWPQLEINTPTSIDEGSELLIQLSVEESEDFIIDSVIVYSNTELLCNANSGDVCEQILYVASEDVTICADLWYNTSCIVTICSEIDVRKVINFFTPNIFSPNNDGNNDVFFVRSNQPSLVLEKFSVFDRWGSRVFSRQGMITEDIDSSWDGKLNGSHVPDGVYLYHLEYRDEENKLQVKNGSVMVIR